MPYAFFDSRLQEAWSAALPATLNTAERKQGLNLLSWGLLSPVGVIHGIELFDAGRNDRLAWALVAERLGRLELQDLFVKPSKRRQGYASRLVREIREIVRSLRLPLVVLVHPVDIRLSRTAIGRLAQRLGVSLVRGKTPWAGLVGRFSSR